VFAPGLRGIAAGDEVIVITWLHRADRDVLETHPRSDLETALSGVFATRSPELKRRDRELEPTLVVAANTHVT
jgi:tRNA (Thr-GGU) A37 N-methylase